MIRSALSILALSAELVSWALLGRPLPALWQVLGFVLAHGLASAGAAWVLCDLLPVHYRKPPGPALLFLFTMSFFLPLVGPVGLCGGFLAARYWRVQAETPSPWVVTEVPDLPFRPLRLRQRFYTEGHLMSLLRHSVDPEQRIKAVMSLRQVSDRLALPVLAVALKDPVDDVRLLAYAMIDGHERVIYGRIRATSDALAAISSAEQGGVAHDPQQGGREGRGDLGDGDPASERVLALRRRLAEDYWELGYLGLASGTVLAQTLASARDHAEFVAAALPLDGGIHLLLGRILIRMERYAEAERALAQAWTAGQPDFVVLWQLAEVAFLQRNFDLVEQLVASASSAGPGTHGRPPLSQVTDYWTCRP